MNVICTKARTLYQTFADSDSDREEEEDADNGPSSSVVHVVPSAFNASKGWFEKFKKKIKVSASRISPITGSFWNVTPVKNEGSLYIQTSCFGLLC